MECPKCGYGKFSLTPIGLRCRRCTKLVCFHGQEPAHCGLTEDGDPLRLTPTHPTVEQGPAPVPRTQETVDG
jgi:hypothetical protein